MKLTAEQFRLGNYISYEKTFHIIVGLNKEICISEWAYAEEEDPYIHYYDQIEGILPEENILIDLGFVWDKTINRLWKEAWSPGHPSQRFDIYWNQDKGFSLVSRYQEYRENLTVEHIKYIHQLQNLYFSITEEELIK